MSPNVDVCRRCSKQPLCNRSCRHCRKITSFCGLAVASLAIVRVWRLAFVGAGLREAQHHCSVRRAAIENVRGTVQGLPSVSVQIVTNERQELLMEALEQIATQDYPGDVEVVVLDDSRESAQPRIDDFVSRTTLEVDYQWILPKRTIGEKRNIAAASTAADIICLWDDDDVYPANRITTQVSKLYTQVCSSLRPQYLYSVDKKCVNILSCNQPMDPTENTLCFRSSWFDGGKAFRESNLAESFGVFYGAADWIEQAGGILSSELPFIYVRRKGCARGDDVRRSAVPRSYTPNSVVDDAVLGMARALHEGQFPRLRRAPQRNSAIRAMREAVVSSIADDVRLLREDPLEASSYYKALCGRDSDDDPIEGILAVCRELAPR